MSITNRFILLILLITAFSQSFADDTTYNMMGEPINPFDVEIIEGIPTKAPGLTESDLCKQVKIKREKHLNLTADLKPGGTLLTDDSSICFTPEENLFFVANQEAQVILGPYAPWYILLSQENRERVEEVCSVIGFETDKTEQAYKNCVKNRYRELMGPYEERYRRESMGYIGERQSMAHQLVATCKEAMRTKRPLLPIDLTFPVALYDRNLNTIPSWMLEEGSLDHLWLKRKGVLKAKDVMQAVLGADCPGNMVLWVTYKQPEGTVPRP
ncbi:MAG: hypothetical protein PUP46_09440 [Endozoicomonas sp. (ex Botrylloides leachii)]|nr:hypothetical protein [Endozoicomonas sp. (ex Botrylloides leachii)]